MPPRQTSIVVFNQMEQLLSARRWEAYRILYEHGPATSNEIFEHARLHGNPNYRHNTNARMTELRDRGVVFEVGTRACSVTGRNVILWDVTDQLPIEPTREPTPRQLFIEAGRVFSQATRDRRPFEERQELAEALIESALAAF